MALEEIKDLEGAVDLPDPNDFIAEHIFGEDGSAGSAFPKKFNLMNVIPHNQARTMHCTAYAITHVMEIMNTKEHSKTIVGDPETVWVQQVLNKGGNRVAMDKVGDSLQNALSAMKKFGMPSAENADKFKIDGYARIEKTINDLQNWLLKGFPVYTGWNGHCFCFVGYNEEQRVFTAMNSYGPLGSGGDGVFVFCFDEVSKLFTPYILFDTKDIKANMIFKDVSENSPYAKEIKWAADVGIFKGYGDEAALIKDKFFRPDQALTRGETAVLLKRLFDLLTNKN